MQAIRVSRSGQRPLDHALELLRTTRVENILCQVTGGGQSTVALREKLVKGCDTSLDSFCVDLGLSYPLLNDTACFFSRPARRLAAGLCLVALSVPFLLSRQLLGPGLCLLLLAHDSLLLALQRPSCLLLLAAPMGIFLRQLSRDLALLGLPLSPSALLNRCLSSFAFWCAAYIWASSDLRMAISVLHNFVVPRHVIRRSGTEWPRRPTTFTLGMSFVAASPWTERMAEVRSNNRVDSTLN